MNTALRERVALSGISAKLLPLVSNESLDVSMRAAGEWLEAATLATGEEGKCFRSATLLEEGGVAWSHPHSNTSEVISAWLELARWSGGEPVNAGAPARATARAQEYALRLVSDPVKGLYRGEQEEAHGMAWYWTDNGTYTGGYSMRAPAALLECAASLGGAEAARLREASSEIGELFLRRQLPNGFVNMVGWCPQRGWLSEEMAGSRYAYSVATFATLWKETGDERYRTAYELALRAIEAMQREDGAFYQHYAPQTLEPLDPSIKVHFFSYLLNALAEAHGVMKDERLLTYARKLGGYISELYGARHQLPYCVDAILLSDTSGANSAVQDSANGLLWLYEATGEMVWLDIGVGLWFEAWLHQPVRTDLAGWHGAIPVGNRRCDLWFITNYIFATARLKRILTKKSL